MVSGVTNKSLQLMDGRSETYIFATVCDNPFIALLLFTSYDIYLRI